MPGVSKGFHFWQPAPRLNNAPMARTRDKKQAPVTLKNQKREGRGEGGGLDDNCFRPRWLKELHTLPDLRHTTAHALPNRPLTAGTVGALCC